MEKDINSKKQSYLIKSSRKANGVLYQVIEINNKKFFLKMIIKNNKPSINHINNEINMLKNIHINNISRMIKYKLDKCILLEYFDGCNLNGYKKMSVLRTISIVNKVCNIIKELHNLGYLHNDIKKANIIIDKNDEVYLIDFGSCTKIGDVSSDGSADASSPEIVKHEPLDCRSDIYSLGILLYKMLIPGKIFNYNSLSEELLEAKRNTSLHVDNDNITDIITKATSFEKEDRYNNVEEFQNEIIKLLSVIDN